MWFLTALFLIEAIFCAAKKLLKKDWAVGSLCAFLFMGYLLLPHGENRYLRTLMQACHYLLYFSVGFYAKAWLEKENKLYTVIGGVILVVVSAIYGRCGNNGLSVENTMFIISGLAGTYAVLQLCKQQLPYKINKLLVTAGRNSMIIYGTHHIIYATVGVLLGITDFSATPLWAGVVMLLIVAAMELPLIYIINRYLPFLAGKRYKADDYAKVGRIT